ncbi:hypothetical protein Taro_010919 [Colocasia esculenta]|uniref:Zinc finger A20 and AN1 domain-containing stress-associated protein 5 n=1 Tax=Colocasia esculenta TaxID=4460 RepID=A0A843U9I8_COLES|nr:hypothetical protein [Colocasia esculenta]
MAQREEETELKVPDNVTLCANNCGRPGSPATKNMCRSCFQAVLSLNSPSCSGHEKRRSSPIRTHERLGSAGGFIRGEASQNASPAEAALSPAPAPARAVNRCSGCRRKVGLTGFRCRCGELFCAEHRYSDRHDCSYDYKAAGREAIERDNPVVKPAKIVRI